MLAQLVPNAGHSDFIPFNSTSGSCSGSNTKASGLSKNAIIGIGIGISLVLIVIVLVLFARCLRKKGDGNIKRGWVALIGNTSNVERTISRQNTADGKPPSMPLEPMPDTQPSHRPTKIQQLSQNTEPYSSGFRSQESPLSDDLERQLEEIDKKAALLRAG